MISMGFSTHARCKKCSRDIEGEIFIDLDTLKLADTKGFMILADGVTCDECIDIPGLDFEGGYH